MEVALEQAASLIRKVERIAITAHIHPDGDSLGSMLALGHGLSAQGKQVSLLLDDDVPSMYGFMEGWQSVRRPSTGISCDLLIALDASDRERLGSVPRLINAPVLNLDHHISNTHYADYWYVDSSAAATGEIIFELLHLLEAPLTPSISVSLFVAIATDCGFFRYANTSPATLRRAAALVENGAKPHIISENLEMVPFHNIEVLTRVLETIELFANGRIAAITVMPDLFGNEEDNTEGFINYPRNIEGVDIAIMFKHQNDNTSRISFRSRGADVSKLALSFGGGGHARAAGCTVSGTPEEVRRRVLEAAQRSLEAGQ